MNKKQTKQKHNTTKHESNLGLKRGRQGNMFKGKKQALSKERATKKIKQKKQNNKHL